MNAPDRFAAAALAGRPPEGELVIDIHAHVDSWSVPTAGVPFWPRSAQELLAASDRVGVRCSVFSHLDALRSTLATDLEAAHRDTESVVRRSEGRLAAHLVLHPHFSRATLERLERLVPGEIFVGAKLHGELHDVRLQSKVLSPFFEQCQRLKLSVLVHLHPADGVGELATIAARYPRLNFLIAHLRPLPAEAGPLFAAHRNLFTDTSLSSSRPGAIEEFIAATGPDRLLYGSDATYLSVGAQFSKLALSGLAPEVKRRVFARNALRAFPLLAVKRAFPQSL